MSIKESFQGLEIWRRTTLDLVRKNDEADLSARQMAVLLNVYLTRPPHTVRKLSADLNISKPAVTRAVDRLSLLGFVKRKTDAKDRRSVDLSRTVAGAAYVHMLGEAIVSARQNAALPEILNDMETDFT